MEAYDVLVTAMASLIMLIVIHLAVFAVIRWMYPEPRPQVRFEQRPPFMEPAQPKEVNVPTYTPPVPVEVPREEGRPGLEKAPSSAAERPAWLVAVDPKTLDT